jgi:DNA polymerase-3 subunit epsilon/exodeoxyribonuclease X
MGKDQLHNLLFLDVETTGLEEDDRLVQVAYVYNGTEHESLFHPGRAMSIRSMEITHITNKHLEGKEKFVGSSFYKELEKILAKEDTIFVAHNASFDMGMLAREGLAVNKFIDTFKIAQELDVKGDIPAYRLQYLRYYLGIDLDDACAHSALGDVKVLVALFVRMYDKMCAHDSHDAVIQKMVHISSQPILIKRFNFGKYNGELIADVARKDHGYLSWLLGQKESDATNGMVEEDWIFTLKKYIR